MHERELSVTPALVGQLVAEQFPAWSHLPVRLVQQAGTVNAIARIGTGLTARFPLQADDPDVVRRDLEREAAAGRAVSGRVRVPTPEPLALGEPGQGYPLPWSVQTWLPGDDASANDPSASTAFALDLAGLIIDLRAIPTHGRTFVGEHRTNRGGTIADHDAWVRTCLERSVGLLDVDRLTPLWERLRVLPRGVGPDVTTHGDLVAGNVLVAGRGVDARLTGLLDVGGVGPADPALDLVAAWHLLDDGPRTVLRSSLGVDDAEWARGVAWAYEQAIGLVWYYRLTNPPVSAMGRRTLGRILRDARSRLD